MSAKKKTNCKVPTPTEKIIHGIILKQFGKLNRPLRNHDIASIHETHRTNIRVHLANMVKKGIIKKHSHKFYIPA